MSGPGSALPQRWQLPTRPVHSRIRLLRPFATKAAFRVPPCGAATTWKAVSQPPQGAILKIVPSRRIGPPAIFGPNSKTGPADRGSGGMRSLADWPDARSGAHRSPAPRRPAVADRRSRRPSAWMLRCPSGPERAAPRGCVLAETRSLAHRRRRRCRAGWFADAAGRRLRSKSVRNPTRRSRTHR